MSLCVQCNREMTGEVGADGIFAKQFLIHFKTENRFDTVHMPFCEYSDCPNYRLLQAPDKKNDLL